MWGKKYQDNIKMQDWWLTGTTCGSSFFSGGGGDVAIAGEKVTCDQIN